MELGSFRRKWGGFYASNLSLSAMHLRKRAVEEIQLSNEEPTADSLGAAEQLALNRLCAYMASTRPNPIRHALNMH